MDWGEDMPNRFSLFVKLIRLDPDTGRNLINVCEIEPQIGVQLNAYTETWLCKDDFNVRSTEWMVADLLEKFHRVFDCPLGWSIQMETFDFSVLNDTQVVDADTLHSEDFAYIPANGQTEVDLSFLGDWVMEPFKRTHEHSTVE